MKNSGWVIVWLFLPGAIFGTALDAIDVYSHVERYSNPVLFGLAWWVPLLFGAAAVAIDRQYSSGAQAFNQSWRIDVVIARPTGWSKYA